MFTKHFLAIGESTKTFFFSKMLTRRLIYTPRKAISNEFRAGKNADCCGFYSIVILHSLREIEIFYYIGR
jgi:hypothetical protein